MMNNEFDIEELIKNRVPMTEKDEYMHDWGQFPKYHNESWYFNFIDRLNKVYFVTRLSFHMDKNKSRLLALLVVDDKSKTYFKEIPLEKMPENWEFDKSLKYYCIKPMEEWRVTFEDKRMKLDVNLKGRFPVFNSAEVEDPDEFIKKYGKEIFQVAIQEHYEQPMIATGTLELKRKGKVYETRNIKGFGNRDHSWGIRHWVQIDNWNWASAQFEDNTVIIARSELMGKSIQFGVIYSKGKENRIIDKIEVTTETEADGKKPVSSKFVLTDRQGNEITIKSKTIFSIYLPLPSRSGKTEIYEQVAIFDWDGKQGDGISEYLMSTRDNE